MEENVKGRRKGEDPQGRRHWGPRGAVPPRMDGAPPDESTYVRTQKCHVISRPTKGLSSFVYLHYPDHIGILARMH